MTAFPLDDQQKAMIADLRRLHLRHPRMVAPGVARLLQEARLTLTQLTKIRLEWNKLDGGKS